MDEKERERRKQAVLQVLNKGVSGTPYNVNAKDVERKRRKLHNEINQLKKEK